MLPPDFGIDEQVADFASVAAIGVSAIQVAVGFYNCDEMTQKGNEYGAKLLAPPRLSRYTADAPVVMFAASVLKYFPSPESRYIVRQAK